MKALELSNRPTINNKFVYVYGAVALHRLDLCQWTERNDSYGTMTNHGTLD